MMKNIPIGNNTDYDKVCLVLSDGTKVYRFVPECQECGPEYYQDELGNKITSPDITGAIPCKLCKDCFLSDIKVENNLTSTGIVSIITDVNYTTDWTILADPGIVIVKIVITTEFDEVYTYEYMWVNTAVDTNVYTEFSNDLGIPVTNACEALVGYSPQIDSFTDLLAEGDLGSSYDLTAILATVPEADVCFTISKDSNLMSEVTIGCNDDRRDSLLGNILEELECKAEVFSTKTKYDVFTGGKVWTLLSKYNNPHPDAASYTGIVFIGALLSSATGNSTHPEGVAAGQSINGWRVYGICAETQPADDSNGHYWIEGSPSSFAGFFTYETGPNADPTGCAGGEGCVEVLEILERDCEGIESCRLMEKDLNNILIPYVQVGEIKDVCEEIETAAIVECVKSTCAVDVVGQRINLVTLGQDLLVTLVIDGVGFVRSFTVIQPTTDLDELVNTWVSSIAGGTWSFVFGAATNGDIGAVGFTGTDYNYLLTDIKFAPVGGQENNFNIEGNCEVETNKSLLTTGCNDTTRDELLEDILEELQDKCLTECVTGGAGGFDITETAFRCSKIGYVINNAFTSLCPDGWSPQQLVDVLNISNPNGNVWEVVSGNIINVVSGTPPELLQFFHSGGGSATIYPSEGGETVCATRVKDCNSDEQTELLAELVSLACPNSVSSNVICASTDQTVTLVGGGTLNITAGFELLAGELYDCRGNLQSFSISTPILDVLTQIDSPVDTGSCPNPSETIPTGCVKDAKGQEWDSFQTVLNGATITYYQDSITGAVGTPAGDPSEWTSCGEAPCLTPDRHCFCVVSQGAVKESVKTLSKTKASASEAPGKILEACRIKFYNCDGELVKTEYEINGKTIDEASWLKQNYKIVPCDSPEVRYIPGAVTCATIEVDHDNNTGTADITLVLNCTVFTNDVDPSDTITNYSLAADYTVEGIGALGDPYTPDGALTVIACAPGSITETETCYEALQSVKGLVNAGDKITVVEVTNSIAGTTIYTITNGIGSELYSGADPLGDAGIDLSDTGQWAVTACVPVTELEPECSVGIVHPTYGGYTKAIIAASSSVTVAIPAVDLARNLTVSLKDNTCFEIEVTMNDGSVYTHATFGGTISKEHQKCESYITQVVITELEGNASEYIVNWQSYNLNTTD